jgi:spore germination cell wall hydrolase CwlJ-like protein
LLVALDKSLLLIVCFREARGDGRDAMRAVAHVIANRVKAWKTDWISAITKPNQFSSMTVLGDSQTVVWPTEQDAVNLYVLISNVYDGTDPDNTNGALYYANEANVTSEWYKTYIMSPTHPISATIGPQTFRK